MDLNIAFERRAQVEEFQRKHRIGLLTLLFADIVGSTNLKQTLGDSKGFAHIQAHHALVRTILAECNEGEEIGTAGDSFFIVFAKPSEAVKFALRLQAQLREQAQHTGTAVFDRIGIHIGEVIIEERKDAARPKDLYGIQVDICARVMSLADGDQILMTRSAFDSARQVLRGQSLPGLRELVWVNHGPYVMHGVDDPIEILEVGESSLARLRAPQNSEKVRRHTNVGAPAPAIEKEIVAPGGAVAAPKRSHRVLVPASIIAVCALAFMAVLKSGVLNSKGTGNVARPGVEVLRIGFEPTEGYVPGRSLIAQQDWERGNWPGQMASGGEGIASGLMPGSVHQAYVGGIPGQSNTTVHAALSLPFKFSPTTSNEVLELSWKQLITDSTNGARNFFSWLFYNQSGQLLGGLAFDNSSRKVLRRHADNVVDETGISFVRGQLTEVKLTIDFQNNVWSAIVGANFLPPQPVTLEKRRLDFGSMAMTWRSYSVQASYSGDNIMAFDDLLAVSLPSTGPKSSRSK